MVRNSALLGTLVEIITGPQGTLRAVEMAGRGVAAEARCSLAILADKGIPNFDPIPVAVQRSLAFADQLIELGEIGDRLEELWQLRRANETDDASFEAKLGHLVQCLEEWPDKAFAQRQVGSEAGERPTT